MTEGCDCEYCTAERHAERWQLRCGSNTKEDTMSDYSAPDPYRDGLAKLRTASGTPETRFEDTYRAMRAREYREESERRDLRFAQERGERT